IVSNDQIVSLRAAERCPDWSHDPLNDPVTRQDCREGLEARALYILGCVEQLDAEPKVRLVRSPSVQGLLVREARERLGHQLSFRARLSDTDVEAFHE